MRETIIDHGPGAVKRAVLVLVLLLGTPTVTAGQGSPEVRIVAYNIKHGRGMDDSVDLARAASVIRALQPDLVALQEIDSATTRTGGVDQAARLGELTGLHAAFGGFMPYRGGRYGMAILSRFPFLEIRNHRLPDGEEPRTSLAVRVAAGGTEIVLAGVHLYRTERERLAQVERLLDALRAEAGLVVLAGDFNSRPGSPVMERVAAELALPTKRGNPMTFPADAPDREIDFVAFRPAGAFELVEYRVIEEPAASDHRPVLMVLRSTR